MNTNSCCYGRTELAVKYFPHVCPDHAWRKLRMLMREYPDLAPLTEKRRRTFTPMEAGQIFNTLGLPQTPHLSIRLE